MVNIKLPVVCQHEVLECPSRRKALESALIAVGIVLLPRVAMATPPLIIENITRLYGVRVGRIETPTSVAQIAQYIKQWYGKISIGGGRYSMGGQVAIEDGLHLDMRQLSNIVWFQPASAVVRVQAGMTWRKLMDVIDPHGLSVKIMQSFSNFTIGGSVSVNCHGRYVGAGPMVNSVRALSIILADGTQVEASLEQNRTLFCAAIGGYGVVGVIAEVELDLAQNVRMARVVEQMPHADYPSYFDRQIKNDANAIMHNADLVPPHFDQPIAVTWRKTDAAATHHERLVTRGKKYSAEQDAIWLLTEVPGAATIRGSVTHPLLRARHAIHWRNFEASLDVASLEPRTRQFSTYALQEYFVPIEKFSLFAKGLAAIIKQTRAEVINVSIRHSPKDEISLLPWAKTEVFSFVVYFKQRTTNAAVIAVGQWTRELIALALSCGGRYYLPYQPHATLGQFAHAYPEIEALKEVKQRVDPLGRFSNMLMVKYASM